MSYERPQDSIEDGRCAAAIIGPPIERTVEIEDGDGVTEEWKWEWQGRPWRFRGCVAANEGWLGFPHSCRP